MLATPLTACLVVVGRHLPQLEWLYVLLSDEEALALHAKLYQRLLALDPESASDILEQNKEKLTQAAMFDDVLLPALRMAERDRHDEVTSPDRAERVHESLDALVKEACRHPSDDTAAEVLCVGASDHADHLSAILAADLLRAQDVPAMASEEALESSKLIQLIAKKKPRLVLVSAVPPVATVQARERARKLAQLFPRLPVVVGVYLDVMPTKARDRLLATGAVGIAESLAEAVEITRKVLSGERAPSSTAA